MPSRFAVIIPACQEAACIRKVLGELREALATYPVAFVVGVNGSDDATAELAREAGAWVAETSLRGYGYGCQAALDLAAREFPKVEAYLFVAADGANDPSCIPALLAEYERGFSMVLGCRTRVPANRAVMPLQYRLANRLLGLLCGSLTGRFFADLGPLRLIDRKLFDALRLREWTFGWTIEAQIRAVVLGARIIEIPVRERRRIAGEQKVSGVTWSRTLQIGLAIMAAGFRTRFATQRYRQAAAPARLRTPPVQARVHP